MMYAIMGFLIILAIAFLVFMWKSIPMWRWYQLLPTFVILCLTITFLFPTARALKSRQAWHEIKEELEDRATEAERENFALKYGDRSDPEAPIGVRELSAKVSKIGVETGRLWRNLRVLNVQNQVITLGPPAKAAVDPGLVDPDAEAAAPAPAVPLVPEGLVVFGFAESTRPCSTNLLPVFYVGEFSVEQTSPTQVTLRPIYDLEPDQIQRINDRDPSWSLYELLPLDGHAPFIAEESEPDNDNIFGRVDDALVKSVLGNDIDDETLQKYLRDGGRSVEGDPPNTRWVKIQFLKTHPFDVDSTLPQGAVDGSFFDSSGRAQDSRLQTDDEKGLVTFRKDDEITIIEAEAKKLIDQKIARLVDTYYVRPLTDYRFELKRMRLRFNQSLSRTKELEFEKGVLDDSLKATNSMLTATQKIKLNLEQDFGQLELEGKAIKDYLSSVESGVKETRDELRRLYRQNQMLEQKLRQLHGLQRTIPAPAPPAQKPQDFAQVN